ncbi:hypothetical protein QCA50_010253 [Cerrena zonata]|uniref:Uncharacterized protein n=1 Tax=Cerrena zonata TaxID=2478898 RepID=A0AAW0FZZ3_9APHY
MLSSHLLRASGLSTYFPECPPEVPGLSCPIGAPGDVQFTSLLGSYVYRSAHPLTYPHRIGLFRPYDSNPDLGLGDKIMLRIEGIPDLEFLLNARSYLVEGWIIGVHFETSEYVEFTLIAKFQRVLQVVFLDVPQFFVAHERSPPFTHRIDGIYHWTYLSVADVESRAREVQGITDDNILNWSVTYRSAQSNLMNLRCTSVRFFRLLDPNFFPYDAHRNIILPDEAHNIMRDEYFAHRAIDALMTGRT